MVFPFSSMDHVGLCWLSLAGCSESTYWFQLTWSSLRGWSLVYVDGAAAVAQNLWLTEVISNKAKKNLSMFLFIV